MIKITIENPNSVEQDYINAIIEPLAQRIRSVKKALDYLRGEAPEITTGEIGFMATATIAIIKEVDADKKNASGKIFDRRKDFTKAKYSTSVNYYRNNPNNLNQVQLTRISNLFNQLLEHDVRELKGLLTLKPNTLHTFFHLYMPNDKLVLKEYNFYIKLAFNYKEHTAITDLVKTFYRTNNFITYCPYCNLDKVEYIANATGQTAARHDLDHFYDKATFPLLCYSMYNLVPSGTTCNQTNKGSIEFTDDYHLNPYSDGFNNSMVFQVVLSGNTKHRYTAVLKSNETLDSARYRKIFGKHDEADNLNYGNINAFKLNTRYQNEMEYISIVERKMQVYNIHALESIKKYINPLKKNKIEAAYKTFYIEYFFTVFDEQLLGNYKYGKLNRDIHDQYFNKMFGNNNAIKEKLEEVLYK